MKRRKHNAKSGRPSIPDPAIVRPVTPFRTWCFRALAAVGLPALGLLSLEIALRLGGYGYPTAFFQQLPGTNGEVMVENDQFGYRFFPPEIARMPPSLRMAAHKPKGTYRIFILGESAALGDPEPAFGVGRYLQVLLNERFPGGHFEVVNVAMTAINSHAILPIARDCARQSGDLWIVYMGNNEMVGPFGATAVFGGRTPPLALIRVGLAIQTTRVGQLLAQVARSLAQSGSSPGAWSGLEMFTKHPVPPDDPHRQRVYANFERNLQDILKAGLNSGTPILLSTVAVNQKDCPPFASQIRSDLPASDRGQIETGLAAGNSLMATGMIAAAATQYEQANQLRPQCADLEYRLGLCLLEATNATAAGHLQKAVDFDCLPFRADARINQVIERTARQADSSRVFFFDADAAIAAASGQAVPGQESFYEHVHFNFDGNYRLARAWAEALVPHLPANLPKPSSPEWASQSLCERRLGLTDWDRLNVLTRIVQRLQHPPWNGQWKNAERVQGYGQSIQTLRKQLAGSAQTEGKQTYLDALKLAPDDFYLHENFADFLSDTGDLNGAIEQWEAVKALIPQDPAADFNLGRLAAMQRNFEKACALLGEVVKTHPGFAPAWFELGRARAEQEDYTGAVSDFTQALKFEPRDARCWFTCGVALARLGRRSEAIEHYRQAVQLDPTDWRAHYELGGLSGQAGNMSEAKTESEAAVRLNPDFPTAHLNLGMALVQLGQYEEAEHQFQEVLRLDPSNSRAADCLAQTRALRQKVH